MTNQDNFWSFKNYRAWKKKWIKCTGNEKNQSPIDIKRDKLESCSSLCRLRLDYKPSLCNVIVHNEVITIRYDAGSFAYLNDDIYELTEAKIHIPSMHLVDGEHYDMEVDLYHCRSADRTVTNDSTGMASSCPDGGLIIGIFVQSGVEFGKSAEFFNQFINKVPIPETLVNEPIEKSIPVSKDWNIHDLLPKYKSFYKYEGSRPYPPCDDNWSWIVFQDYVTIGSTNYETLKYNLNDNYRPHLPLYDRIVYHYNETKLESIEEDKEISETGREGSISLLEKNKRQAWFERNKDFIKKLLYTCIVIALIILALRTVVVVLKKGLFQDWIQKQLLTKQLNNSQQNISASGINPSMAGMNPSINPSMNPNIK
jgi:carbonic anhydrase